MKAKKADITWQDFEKIDIRIGTILEARDFKEARKPAFILHIDFGPGIGTLKSSAQITDLYSCEELTGRQVAAVVNFPPKQIGPIHSECLCLGVVGDERGVVLLHGDRPVSNGLSIA